MNEHTLQPKLVGLQAELLEMIEADERALELLRKRAQKNRELLNAVNGSLNAFAAKVTGSGKLTDTVREVVRSLAPRFTPIDVEHALTAKFPTVPLDKNGLRTVLWNMTKRGEIKCTRKGTNRLPAEYEQTVSVIGHEDAATVRVRRRPVQAADLLEPSNGAHV